MAETNHPETAESLETTDKPTQNVESTAVLMGMFDITIKSRAMVSGEETTHELTIMGEHDNVCDLGLLVGHIISSVSVRKPPVIKG